MDFLESFIDNAALQGTGWAVGSEALLFYIIAKLSNKLVIELCSLSMDQELSLAQPMLKSSFRQDY